MLVHDEKNRTKADTKHKDNRRKRRWFMCAMAASPSAKTMASMRANGVTDLRWCQDGEILQAFLHRPCGVYEEWWTRNAIIWGLTPSSTTQKPRVRSEPLWETYAAGKGGYVRDMLLQIRLLPAVPTRPESPVVPEAQWRGLLREFMALARPLRGPVTMLAVAHSMFQGQLTDACSRLMSPCHASYAIGPQGGDISTLELHRRVLRLERAAADLAHHVKRVAGLNAVCVSCQEQSVREDLECVIRYGGGLCGGGGDVWAHPFHVTGSETRSMLMLSTQLLRGSRQTAFAREYAPVEDTTWGLPMVCRLAVTLHATPLATPKRLMDVLVHFFSIRSHIIDQEKQPLLVYGAHLTCYCRRLQQLAMLTGPLPAHLYMPLLTADGVLQVYTQNGYVVAPAQADVPIPIDDRFCNGPFTSPADVRAMVQRRRKQETQEMHDILRLLGIRAPPAIACLHRFQKNVLACMCDDSHLKNATKHLPPTPSLQNAAFNAEQYM